MRGVNERGGDYQLPIWHPLMTGALIWKAALAGSIAGAVTLVVVYAVGEDYDEGYDMLVKTQVS